MRKRHPLNVVGPFYVEDGCCTACGLPHAEAPGFLAALDDTVDGYCYVVRQPENEEQLDRAICAMVVAEFNCIRYAGADPIVLEKVRHAGKQFNAPDLLLQCDVVEEDNR